MVRAEHDCTLCSGHAVRTFGRKLGALAAALLVPITAAFPDDRPGWTPFLAFAYSSGTLTATGQTPRPGLTVAADPGVLPMGSRILITGADQYSGVYVVGDTGAKIKGRMIDIFMHSREAALQFGRKAVQVKILHLARRPAAPR